MRLHREKMKAKQQQEQYLRAISKKKKRNKKKWINTSEDEIKVALDKIFGPRNRVNKKPKRFRSEMNQRQSLNKNTASTRTLKDWTNREVCMNSKETITNRLAKTNVYFQTRGIHYSLILCYKVSINYILFMSKIKRFSNNIYSEFKIIFLNKEIQKLHKSRMRDPKINTMGPILSEGRKTFYNDLSPRTLRVFRKRELLEQKYKDNCERLLTQLDSERKSKRLKFREQSQKRRLKVIKSSSCRKFLNQNKRIQTEPKSLKKSKSQKKWGFGIKKKSQKKKNNSLSKGKSGFDSELESSTEHLKEEDFWRFDKENLEGNSRKRHQGIENIGIISKKKPKAFRYRQRNLSERALRRSIRDLVHDPKKYYKDVRGAKESRFARTMGNFRDLVNRPPPTNEDNILQNIEGAVKKKKELVDFNSNIGIKE